MMKGIHSTLESPPWATPVIVEKTLKGGAKVRQFQAFYGYAHFAEECRKHGWTRWIDLDEIENNGGDASSVTKKQ